MDELQQLKDIYDRYIQDVAKVYQEAKPADGLFGWGDDPRKDPCHMRFYEDVQQWTKAFLASGPEQEALFEAARILVETPDAHREKHCFWFMYAAHGLILDMIPGLSAQQCAYLRDFYDGAYPKRDRMPVQRNVYKLLKKGAK